MDKTSPSLPSKTLILAITGGSGSGKTTVADALRVALSPRTAVVLREDDYYRDNRATPGFDPERFNFDDVAARDHALLAQHLRILKAGRSIEMPRYDFVDHTRRPERVTVEPATIVIVEGTHVLCTEMLRPLFDYSIYLDVPDDIRLIRRIRRDVAERQRSVETVIRQYLQTVRPMHYRQTEPCRALAHTVVKFPENLSTAESAEQEKNLRVVVADLARRVSSLRV